MAKLEIKQYQFFFNLDADVGRASPNKLDDVELVRFGYFCVKSDPKKFLILPTRFKVALQSMQPRGPYLADLQGVIDAHQEHRGGTQDGKVSVGKAQFILGRYDSKHLFMIYALCNAIADFLPNMYPRIDLHDQSGIEISKRVQVLFRVD